MTFNDPVVGGNTLIRHAIQSPNYQSGSQGQGWAINEDGSADFNNLTTSGNASGANAAYDNLAANLSFTYQGQELSTILSAYSQGLAGFGTFSIPAGTVTTTAQTLGGITWNSSAGRSYRYLVNDVTYSASPTGFGLGAKVSLVLNGTTVMNAQEIGGQPGDGLGHSFIGNSNTDLGDAANTLLVQITAQGATTLTMIVHTVAITVEDMGPIVPNTGFAGSISGPSSHTFTMNAIRSASYQGGGAQSNGSGVDAGDRMYFGQDPGYAPNGNWRSYAWFNTGTNLSAMAGYSSCSKFDLTVSIPWWYATAGGTLYIGYHNDNSGAVPGSEPASHSYQLVTGAFTARGQTKTISLLGNTTIMNAVKAGTFKGIILGPGPSTSYSYYGYGDGSDHGRPTIAATYLK